MIIPGILEKSWSDIEDKIEIVYNRKLSGVDTSSKNIIYREKVTKIQIDFCDGVYVKSQTWSPLDVLKVTQSKEINGIVEKGLPYWEGFDYEADLMVNSLIASNKILDPDNKGLSNMSKYIEAITQLGFSKVVLHFDEENEIHNNKEIYNAIDFAYDNMLSVGVSSRDMRLIIKLLNNTDYVDKIDYIQIMGIENIGYQNQPFYNKTLENIKVIKNELDILNKLNIDQEGNIKNIKHKIRIQIDGAMNNDAIQMCKDAGADDFVMGSAYFKSN